MSQTGACWKIHICQLKNGREKLRCLTDKKKLDSKYFVVFLDTETQNAF